MLLSGVQEPRREALLEGDERRLVVRRHQVELIVVVHNALAIDVDCWVSGAHRADEQHTGHEESDGQYGGERARGGHRHGGACEGEEVRREMTAGAREQERERSWKFPIAIYPPVCGLSVYCLLLAGD